MGRAAQRSRSRRRRWRRLAGACLIAAGAALTGVASAAAPPRPTLVFDLDQGFEFGITENRDLASLARILDVVAKFEPKFDVAVLFNPMTRKTRNLRDMLNATAARGIPFLLDAVTSDALTIGNLRIETDPGADPAHGLTLSAAGLGRLKQDPKLAPAFAGLRFMEVMAEDFTVRTCKARAQGPDRVDWCDGFAGNLPRDDFLQPERILRPLLDFAVGKAMWVMWSDWKWDRQTAAQQSILKRLLVTGRYAGTIVPTYADNLPLEAAREDRRDWRRWRAEYQPLVGRPVRALGFSDQSWTCDDEAGCPAEVLVKAALAALAAPLGVLELEPSWHFFDLPARPDPTYPGSAQWRNQGGRPTDTLVLLARALGVDLAATEPKPASSGARDQALCLRLDAPGPVKAGAEFTLSVAFRNTGANAWSADTEELRLGEAGPAAGVWGAARFPLTPSRVGSGADADFAVHLRAPAAAGRHRLAFEMSRIGGGGFGQRCARLVSVLP